MKLTRQTSSNDRARQIGVPGGSARAAYRTQRALLQRMSWRSRLSWLLAICVLGAGAAAATGRSPLIGAVLAGSVTLAAVAVITVPQTLQILAVLAVYTAFAFPVGAVFIAASAQPGQTVDLYGGGVALMVAAFIATWASVKYSRGRAWVTLAVALGASVLGGLLLVAVVPSLGVNAARIALVAVLLVRCGGWAWAVNAAGLAWDALRHRPAAGVEKERPATSEDQKSLSEWLRREDAEKRTARLLADLPAGSTVFHDVTIKRSPVALPHLVIGPTGVFLLASVVTAGPISETARDGVQIPGIPLGSLTASLLQQRRLVARTLRVKDTDLEVFIVVHPEGPEADVDPATRRTLAVFDQSSGSLPTASVIVVGADTVASALNSGIAIWPDLTVRGLVRRARLKLTQALAPMPIVIQHPDKVSVAAVDEDGRIMTALSSDPVDHLDVGARIDIMTTRGLLKDLRVAGPVYADQDGIRVVPVCVAEEWVTAAKFGRKPTAYPYPVTAILKAV